MAEVERKQTKVVQSEDVIGMLMGIEDGVNDSHILSQQLLAQVWGCVDQEVAFRQTDYCGTASAFIARIITAANLAATADGRDSNGRAGSQ